MTSSWCRLKLNARIPFCFAGLLLIHRYQRAYVIMSDADALAPNRHQAISSHHADMIVWGAQGGGGGGGGGLDFYPRDSTPLSPPKFSSLTPPPFFSIFCSGTPAQNYNFFCPRPPTPISRPSDPPSIFVNPPPYPRHTNPPATMNLETNIFERHWGGRQPDSFFVIGGFVFSQR